MLEPKLALLDETDSGLDIDALKIVANGINNLRDPKRAVVLRDPLPASARTTSFPTSCTCSHGGRIVKSGGKDLAVLLEKEGYGWIDAEKAAV